jgi:tetratricopeptide (TPR) repeat protein
VLSLCLLASPGLGRAETPDDGAWQKQIAELESRLFEPIMPVDEVDRLLEQLKLPDVRAKAAKQLAERGQGHVERVVAFARDCPDMEARQACADVLEALDSSYRTFELGKQLGVLYREHSAALLGAYWARFRKDPLDPRAVAMLMHGDAEKVYAALGKTADRHDQVRYLLLRIRELTPDKFARQHIFEHTASGAELVMTDVFPNAGYRRIVGQVGLSRIIVGTYNSNAGGLPKIDYLNVCKRTVYVYRYPSMARCAVLAVTPYIYSPKGMNQDGRVVREIESLPEQVCRLPQLKWSQEQEVAWANNTWAAPWWAKPYVPPAYQERVVFGLQPSGAVAPEVVREERLTGVLSPKPGLAAAKTDSSAPSVVMLPPRFGTLPAPQVESAAGLACDRLAQEIAAAGLARVVDRTQLDRLLREREPATSPPKPLLSYDAMLRMEVDDTRLPPQTRLSVIDLSTGNVLEQRAFGWPLDEGDVTPMLALCRDALKNVAKPAAGKLRVRTLWATEDVDNERIRPLGRRLIELFDESLRRSDRVLLVHHLEAATSKEESLLLLMGLSRLPGGRQFAPQADATIELALREGEGRGKTFQETPLEIRVRITRSGSGRDQSLLTAGTVAQFDRAAAEAWEKLAGVLREARPGAAAGWLDEMAVRRRQAEAELRIARTLRGDPLTPDLGKLLARVAHTEAAMKIDPTSEEAALEHLASLGDACFRALSVHKGETQGEVDELAERILAGAVQYFDRFDPKAANRAIAHEACRIAVHLGLIELWGRPLHEFEWTPRRAGMVQSARLALEDCVKHCGGTRVAGYEAMALVSVGRAMKRSGVPIEQRQQWIDGILRQCARNEAEAPKADGIAKEQLQTGYNELWLRAAELAVDDGRRDRAKALVAQLRDRIAASANPPWPDHVVQLRALVARLDDAAALAEFDRWVKELNSPGVQRLALRCPATEPYHDKDELSGYTIPGVLPSAPSVLLRQAMSPHGYGAAICALAADEKRLYVVMDGWITSANFEAMAGSGHSQVVAALPLDEAGHPLGKAEQVSRPVADSFWDTLKPLAQPSVAKPLQVLAARCLGGKLYLGTLRNGLLVFDPKSEKWSSFGPEQGLPAEAIHAFYPLDDHTLFCAGRDAGVCYTIELPEGKVTLRHHVGGNAMERTPLLFWRSGAKLLAWSRSGLCGDLLSPQFTFTERAPAAPFGWNVPGGGLATNYPAGFVSVAEIAGRRFVTNAGLHEFDASGRIVHSWWASNRYQDDRGGMTYCVPLPPDCPMQSQYMVVMGSVLVFVEPGSILAWDPKSDTWYGPLAPGGDHAIGTPAGLWLGGRGGLLFVAADDVFAAAKGAGRVLTTAQYRQRQQEIIAALPLLDRATAAFAMHQFDKAEPLLEKVLQDDPASAYALLLMGYLHDVWCLNQPDTALQFYQRLADVKADPNASFTGWYQRFVLLRTLQRWPETLAVIDQIDRRFPRPGYYERRDMDWWRDYAGQQLAARAAPSVLVLPPRLPAGAGDAARAAADAVCDRLAQDIAAAGLARVVDRTQIDRILQERSLRAEPPRPMLSYDAMLRLEADTTRLAPETMLSLIDLSTGNILAQRAFAWPPKEADAKPMLDFCRDALKSVPKPAAGKLRVRALWSEDAIASERIRPLGKRLIEVFDGALQRSDRVVLVHHLEAGSAKEESLLLLMGLSRLPAGRQFAPQADATVELRVVEGDGRGKTFPETPVEIGVRLRKGAAYQGDWLTTAGLVRDFDALVPQAWQKLAQSLGEVRPETASTWLNEMSLRRKQAEAEVQTVIQLLESRTGENALLAALGHAEAAVKLDPTYPEAARAHIDVLGRVCCSEPGWQKRFVPDAPLRTLREAARYVERFSSDGALCGDLCTAAIYGLYASPLWRLLSPHDSDSVSPAPAEEAALTITPELAQALDAAKQLLERGIEDDVKFRYDNAQQMMRIAFRGMRLLDVPAAERQAWLEKIGGRCRDKIKRGVMDKTFPENDWYMYVALQVCRAQLLMEDGQVDAARGVLAQARSDIPAEYYSRVHGEISLIQAEVRKANDARLLAEVNAWTQRGEKMKVHLIYMNWPAVDLYARKKNVDSVRPATTSSPAMQGAPGGLPAALLASSPVVPCYDSDRDCPAPKMPLISADARGNYRPLGDGDGRLYFFTMSPPSIAYIPLDARGRPVGKAVRSPRPFGGEVWDSIQDIPQPDWRAVESVTSARYMDGKLYVGTHGAGLLMFDPKTASWKGYGPEQGLPSRDVDEFFPIGGNVLYCNARRTHYMLNLADGAVTLVHRADLRTWETDWMVDWNLRLAWGDGQRVVAVDDGGVWDNLLSKARKRTPLPGQACYGWHADDGSQPAILGVAEANGRRFCVCRGGLYELDAAGKVTVLRAWETTNYWLHPAGWHINAPADCPIPDLNVACAAGSHLVFTGHLTIYDINSDTWYGPVNLGLGNPPLSPLATSQGMLWGAGPTGLTCLALDDAVAYAKSLGRAMTTAEYRRRKQQFIDAATPLDRAKFALSMRQFDTARAALQQVLDAEPNQPDALLLMGLLHVRECLNRPDEAIKYYRRAAELQNDPVASYSGMYFWACVLLDHRRWQETIDLCEKILRRYPGLDESNRAAIERFRDDSRRQLARKDAKPPAAGTSNNWTFAN